LKVAINALTLPKNLAGIGFYTEQLVRHLTASDPGLEISLFTNRGAADGLKGLGGRVRIVPFAASSIPAKALAAQALLPMRLSGFDVLHSVGNVGLRLCPIPQVATIHDLCQKVIPSRFGAAKRAYLNLGEAWSVRLCDRIITVSRCTEADLVRFFPSASGKATTIHSASKYPIERREKAGAGDFLFVGTLEPGKNLPLALEALARMRERHGKVAGLRIVGARGWRQSQLPALIAKLGLERQLTFLGYLDDAGLKAEYQSARCLIFPSLYEGFGLPILEAQSQGCPVISADNSSLREIGGAGCRYFPTGGLEALTDLMLLSLQDPEGFSRVRDEGYANCARYDWAKTARETLEVYRSVARTRP
jgi:glycosyltransferase involved in cell wall biosynthesis